MPGAIFTGAETIPMGSAASGGMKASGAAGEGGEKAEAEADVDAAKRNRMSGPERAFQPLSFRLLPD